MTALRTCVGCRTRAPRALLQRFVLGESDRLRPDPGARLPGRGAWLHRSADCRAAFARQRGTVRSLRAAPSRAAREVLIAALEGLDRGAR